MSIYRYDPCICVGGTSRGNFGRYPGTVLEAVGGPSTIDVSVINDENYPQDVYFFVKLVPGGNTLQYMDPVKLVPREVYRRSMPLGVQIDVRIQYYTQWCRKIWNEVDIREQLTQEEPLLLTSTGLIGKSTCRYGTWITRGEVIVDPRYISLGLETNYPSPYQILGVKPGTSIRDIKLARDKLVRMWHPDKWVLKSPEDQNLAAEVVKLINEAYEEIVRVSEQKPSTWWWPWSQ